MDVDHRLQSRNGSRCLAPTAGNGLAGGFLQLVAHEAGSGGKLAAIGDGTVVAPIENRLEAVVLGTGFQGNIDGIVGMAVGEADTGMETVAGILAQKEARLDELVAITKMGEVAFHANPAQLVVEISLQRGMGIDSQGDAKDLGKQLGVVDMKVEAEIVGRLREFFFFPGRGENGRQVPPENIEEAGRKRAVGVVALDIAAQKGGNEIEALAMVVRTAGHQLEVVQEIRVFRGGVFQAVDVDFAVHLVDGASGKVGLQTNGKFGSLVFFVRWRA